MNDYILKKNHFVEIETGKKILFDDIDIRDYYDSFFEIQTTLEEFMSFLEFFSETINKDFKSWHKGIFLDDFLKEIKKRNSKSSSLEDATIYFFKVLDINEYYDEITEEKETEIDDYCSIYYTLSNKKDFFSIGLIELNKLKKAKMVLIDEITVQKNIFKEQFENEILATAKTKWTLHQIISTFIYEITFYGYPHERNSLNEKLNTDILLNELKNEIFSNENYIKSSDEMKLLNLKQRLLEEELKENYEICKKIKDKIDILEKQIFKEKNKKNQQQNG